MYYSHFGLNQPPFKITPNTDFFFSGGNRGPVLEALIYAISQGEGIVKVTGEVGSGKTMLCHMLQTRLPDHVESVYIANPSVSPEEILQAIAFELQLGVPRDASRLEVMQALHDYLLKRHSESKRVVVFVEESQSMPLPTLEEIRLLSNLETKNDKLLQIVLFGQPELDENLRKTNIRQLRERITHSFRLAPLSAAETREYLMFRMRAAGYHGPELFSEPVIKAVSRAAQGLTRRVNLIADKALLAAFSENTHTIKRKHVDAAVRDSEFSALPGARAGLRPFWGIALIALGAAAGVGIYVALQESATTTGAPIATEAKGRIARLEEPMESRAEAGKAASQRALARPGAPAMTEGADDAAAPSGQKPDVPLPRAEDKAAPNAAAAPPAVQPGPKPQPAPGAPAVVEAKPSPQPIPEVKPVPKAESSPRPAPAARVASAPQTPGGVQPDAPMSQKVLDSTDVLDSRIVATQDWLGREAPETFSIQLLGTNDATLLRFHLNELGKLIEMNKVFVYRTTANQKPFLTVLFGSFNSYRAAQEALDKLPESLKVNRPFLRTVGGIREEIARLAKS
jgi:type II secretory pathway predicted ATPase ExeA/septal ring-binding cell division protein DamX